MKSFVFAIVSLFLEGITCKPEPFKIPTEDK
jgi:hypothetical protein